MDNDFNENWFDNEEENCPLAETIMSMIALSKPFGMLWHPDMMCKFLKERGYKIIERFDEEQDRDVQIAVKKNSNKIPTSGNLMETFLEEVRNILFKWLLKIANENDT